MDGFFVWWRVGVYMILAAIPVAYIQIKAQMYLIRQERGERTPKVYSLSDKNWTWHHWVFVGINIPPTALSFLFVYLVIKRFII